MKVMRIAVMGLVLASAAGAVSAAAGVADDPSPVVKWTPAEPKWGDTLVVTYDPGAPKAALAPGDEVFLLYTFPPHDKVRTVRLEKDGDVLSGGIVVEEGTAFLSAYVITAHGWDPRAKVGVMVRRLDGRPARGAWQQKMINDFSPETYRASFDQEMALYPDNYAAYRDKWMIESMVKRAEFKAIVDQDVAALEKRRSRNSPAGLLFALASGHWLAGREEAGREHLRRLVETAPDDALTAAAFEVYDYQAFTQQWKGQGPDEARRLALGLIERDPGRAKARRLFERAVFGDLLSLETARAVCGAWIKDEPKNPHPYYYLAVAERTKRGDPASAEAMAEKALELTLKGYYRFYGDIGGNLGKMRLPGTYALLAEIRRDLGEQADALAAIKTARALTKETLPDHAAIEASIWAALGASDTAEACWLEARALGHKDAEKEIRAIYEKRRGTAEGFGEYLAEKLKAGAKGGAAKGGGPGPGAAGGGPGGAGGGAGASARRPAPELAFKTLDGRETKLSELRGKVVVLNFWFIGCAPCRVEIPGLNKLVEQYKGKDVVFLGIATDPAKALREFLGTNPFKYEIVPDGEAAANAFGVLVYPTHVIIDKDGAIAYFLTGGSPERHEQLAPLIDALANASR